MSRICTLLLAVLLSSCNGFVGEVDVREPAGPPIKIADPDFVVLRSVSTEAVQGAQSATLNQQTLYFNLGERILDLRHLDPRTARVEGPRSNAYVVSIHTTDEGDKLLGAWTSANLEKQLGIFVGNRLISAPFIKSKITGMIVLDGDFTQRQAEELLARLRRGGAAVAPQ
jgi:preprotein translocase subunit SecD